MYAFKSVINSSIRNNQIRNLATHSKSGVFKPKTTSEIWLGDSGAYPVMFVIGFAVVFSLGTGIWFMATSPDARISKYSRKTLFRGELKGEKLV
mmetsp:Transcript_15311/g.13848  ORF Transcript_15311/g.13848 Transcript_15311/m.13848 type:complete len:94 (-) Transcript_15311:51-332(-)